MSDRDSVLTHVYGIAGLVPGLISIVALIKSSSPWEEYALVGSGWLAAFCFAFLLSRGMRMAKEDGLEVARLRAREATLISECDALEKQAEQRGATADFLASLLVGKRATPRAAPAANPQIPAPAPPENPHPVPPA